MTFALPLQTGPGDAAGVIPAAGLRACNTAAGILASEQQWVGQDSARVGRKGSVLPDGRYGATPEEWMHWAINLGLASDLLPCVMNPEARPTAKSDVQPGGFAKIPSMYNAQGLAHGITTWPQKISTAADIALWAKEPDYGIGVHGRDAVGLDVDVENGEQVEAILALIEQVLGFQPPIRTRASSSRVLLILRVAMPAEQSLRWRGFKTGHGLVELLATGKQFVVAGRHKSGDRYEWRGGLPMDIPTIPFEVFEALWQKLAEHFAIEAPREASDRQRQRGPNIELPDPVADFLFNRAMVMGTGANGALQIECPWEHEHTTPSTPGSTAWLPAGSNSYPDGHFKCFHAHCANRYRRDYLAHIGFDDCNYEALPDEPGARLAPNRFERLRPISWRELAARPPISWLVKGILPQFGLGMIYGAPSSGKSFLALDLAAAVARGVPWRGRRVRQAKVLYVCAEGEGGFPVRLKAYEQYVGPVAGEDFYLIPGRPNLVQDNDADLNEVISGAKALGVGLVVIDTLAQVSAGGDENSSTDMGRVIERCQQIRDETGAFVLLVHHAGKDDSRGARGWSGIKAAVDVEIKVSRNESGVRTAEVTKQKDGDADIKLPFQLKRVFLGVDADGDSITSCVVDALVELLPEQAPVGRGPLQKAIVEALAGGLPMQVGEVLTLAQKLSRKPGETQPPRKDNIKRALGVMFDAGLVIMERGMVCLADSDPGPGPMGPHSLSTPNEDVEEMRERRSSSPHSLTHPKGVSSEEEEGVDEEEVE